MNNTDRNTISLDTDMTFIGSGITTSFILLSFLKNLSASDDFNGRLKLTIVEKDAENFTGLAYGPRSGSSALLITSLADFLPESLIRQEFIKWLSQNKETLISELRADGGKLSENWTDTHKIDIQKNNWEDIYIPRRFFGIFIKQKVNQAIADFSSTYDFQLKIIQDEAIGIDDNLDSFQVYFKNRTESLSTKKIILSVGIPPVKQLWSDDFLSGHEQAACLVKDPYNPGLDDNLHTIATHVNKQAGLSNILIIGSNASAMEMLYKLHDVPEITAKIGSVSVISPHGELPHSGQDKLMGQQRFVPTHLLELNKKYDLTAKDIYEATSRDLDEAEAMNLGTAISEGPISKAFVNLLDRLSHEELGVFACRYGNLIGKRQRRAGKHYNEVVERLNQDGRLKLIKGYYNNLEISADNQGLIFSYRSSKSRSIREHEGLIDVVISCVGSRTLIDQPVSVLIDNLVQKGICKVNDSGIGFAVNDQQQTATNFFVAGPLLAGNVLNGMPLWHLEHCGRIIKTGERLAGILAQQLIHSTANRL
ncbi:MAG: hypothetical protein HKO94_04420 [Flavobacteriaceae bacterium]|nr:hypothetical protein [Flavobacteriaceae bacterium]